MDQNEDYLGRSSYRAWQLRRLHQSTAEVFMSSQGFGVARLGPVREQILQLPELVSIPFDQWQTHDEMDTWSRGPYRFDGRIERDADPVRDFHRVAMFNFLSPAALGSISGFRQVAGFVPHAFRRLPRERYELQHEVDRLQLVSLQRFDQPMVYVTKVLPRMDQLSGEEVPVRAL